MAYSDSSVRPFGARLGAEADATAFLNRVYGWMTVGLVLTGATALYVASSPDLFRAIVLNRLVFYALIGGELALVLAFSAIARRVGFAGAAAMFLAYAVLNGLTLSVVFLAYTGGSVATAFFITAGTFGGMSLFGRVTHRDLSGWGSFLMMGLWGVVLASLVNLFVGSDLLSWVLSCAGVVVFTGLAAYDTQKLRALALADGVGSDSPLAIQGALMLYLDFINLFLSLLRLLGNRR